LTACRLSPLNRCMSFLSLVPLSFFKLQCVASVCHLAEFFPFSVTSLSASLFFPSVLFFSSVCRLTIFFCAFITVFFAEGCSLSFWEFFSAYTRSRLSLNRSRFRRPLLFPRPLNARFHCSVGRPWPLRYCFLVFFPCKSNSWDKLVLPDSTVGLAFPFLNFCPSIRSKNSLV